MKKLFEPSDFRSGHPDTPETYVDAHKAANIANAKLDQFIQSCPVVYLSRCKSEITYTKKDEKDHIAIHSNFKNSYYSARLVQIEELAKKECIHDPEQPPVFDSTNKHFVSTCRYCDADIIADWKAKK